MGYGDDIMATAEARAAARAHAAAKVVFGDGRRVHWSAIFWSHPQILQPGEAKPESLIWLANYPGHRPSIDYAASGESRFAFRRDFRAVAGDIHFAGEEIEKVAPVIARLPARPVVIEPNVKGTVSGANKDWGFARWQAVVDRHGGWPFVQLGPADARTLKGVVRVATSHFRAACAIVKHAALFLGTDGGLHHAAAAFGVPGVVIFGGYSSPANFGYRSHRNLADRGPESPCGRVAACAHCRAAMAAIPVDRVIAEAEDLYARLS